MKCTIQRHCPKCGHEYICQMTDQEPGCRDFEEERCPYCDELVRVSMEYEFYTIKLEDLR